jgi:short-subunit dehydrogenase
MKIEGSNILLTGASSGIGAALARALAAKGATLGLVARREDRLNEVLAEIHPQSPDSRVWVADLADLERAEAIVHEAEAAFGRLDGLINNAAIPSRRRITSLSREELDHVMQVDFTSPVRMGMAALPGMLDRTSGLILNVSSMGGRLGIAREAAYCSAKFALCGWTEVMYMELLESGVEVKLVLPGPIDTEIWTHPDADPPHFKGPLIPAQDCANGIVDAIEAEGFEYYVPDMRAIAVAKTQGADAFLQGAARFAEAAS